MRWVHDQELEQQGVHEPGDRLVVGEEIATTLLLLLISPVSRSMVWSSGSLRCSRELDEGEHVVLGTLHHVGELREASSPLVYHDAPLGVRGASADFCAPEVSIELR